MFGVVVSIVVSSFINGCDLGLLHLFEGVGV